METKWQEKSKQLVNQCEKKWQRKYDDLVEESETLKKQLAESEDKVCWFYVFCHFMDHIRFLLVRANKFAKWKTGLSSMS